MMRTYIDPETDNRAEGRTCTSCWVWKTWEKFYEKKDNKWGHDSRCKDCRTEQERKKYDFDPDASKAKGREQYQKHKGQRRQDARDHYWSDPKKHRKESRDRHRAKNGILKGAWPGRESA